MLMRHKPTLVGVAVLIALAACPVDAHDYRFHISCQQETSVVWWETGDVDPGREYLRVATGLKHPDCSITDYDEKQDANLPVTHYKGGEAVLQGFPPISIICGIFGC
jgi:hypothetical protein